MHPRATENSILWVIRNRLCNADSGLAVCDLRNTCHTDFSVAGRAVLMSRVCVWGGVWGGVWVQTHRGPRSPRPARRRRAWWPGRSSWRGAGTRTTTPCRRHGLREEPRANRKHTADLGNLLFLICGKLRMRTRTRISYFLLLDENNWSRKFYS